MQIKELIASTLSKTHTTLKILVKENKAALLKTTGLEALL